MHASKLHPPRAPRLSPGLARRVVLALALLLVASGCGETQDWSPLDGPWDPSHPDAARILEPPAPDAPIDTAMAQAGERWYRVRGCLACHRVQGDDVLGPTLGGVTLRREYTWFRGMVLRPDSMLVHDPVARALLEQYGVPMPSQQLNDLQVRAIWEYLRAEVPTGPPPPSG
jgi:mono/diheme cytochrome c family protein